MLKDLLRQIDPDARDGLHRDALLLMVVDVYRGPRGAYGTEAGESIPLEKVAGWPGTIPVLAQRAASEGPR